ncbi:MAG TPA: hypothetical protein VHC22_24705 [Pirellulales bacterium]|nr:hypothetical protein [Pirellulales bacterium]
MMASPPRAPLTCALALVLGACSVVRAAPPTVRNVDVRGLQIGATTTIAFDGTDLPANPRLMMSVPIASQVVRPGATAAHVEIDVTLDGSVQPGFYNAYLWGESGISEKTVVACDRLSQRRYAPTIDSLPVALHGTLPGGTTLRTTFTAQAGQRLMCEVESQRLAGKLRPVLHLFDAQERHLAWSLPSPALRGDTRLAITVPADGQYTLTLHDLQFAAPAPGHFRLKIGDWQYADAAFPAGVQRGTTASLRLIGNLPADKRLVVPVVSASEISWLRAAWSDAALASGPTPAVTVSDLPELVEQSGPELQELPTAPAAVNGCLSVAGEEDRYRLKAAADTKLRCELMAARLGAPIDSVVEIRRADGGVLATNDDVPGTTDSLVEFTMPKETDSLVVSVRDALGRGGDASIYRLLVTPVDAPQPDFRLSIERDTYNVVQGSRQVVRVRVERQAYQGPIGLEFGQLPWGVALDAAEIPAGSNGKLITLAGSADAPQCALVSVRGRAARGPVRTAPAGTNPLDRDQPWLAAELPVSLAARDGVGFDADWQPAVDAKLVLSGKFAAPVRCVRPAGYDGPVRLSLLTSQNPPQVNGVDDPNRTLRPEPNVPVEIASDGQAVAKWDAKLMADKTLADAQAALAVAAKALADAQVAGGAALEAATKAKAEADARVADAMQKKTAADEAAIAAAAAAKNDVAYNLAVPADLPAGNVEIAFRAELLSRDRQRTLMTVCTPVRTISVSNPLRLQYGGPPKLSAKIDRQVGAALKLAGKVERLEGLTGDVTVTISGLPAGINVPRVVVPAAQTDFELELKFPPNTAAGVIGGLQLVATGRMTPSSPLEIRSEAVHVAVELLPPE